VYLLLAGFWPYRDGSFLLYQAAQPMNQSFDGSRGLLLPHCQRSVDTMAALGFPEPVFIERAG
jgi:hypothetical protein